MALTSGGVTALSIRRHGYRTVTLPQLREVGTLDSGLEQFLRSLVRARKNILITGGTGSGNTTLRLRHIYWMMSDRSLGEERAPRRRGGSGPVDRVDLRVASSDQHGNRE
jgi:hypothetical protein